MWLRLCIEHLKYSNYSLFAYAPYRLEGAALIGPLFVLDLCVFVDVPAGGVHFYSVASVLLNFC